MGPEIGKSCRTILEVAHFHPVQAAEITIEDRRGGIVEIFGCVGIGAHKGDFLQCQAP